MIGDLNTKFRAREQRDYEILPEGEYNVVVEEINPWEKKTKKNVMIIQRDENGYPLKDEKGNIVKEKVEELTFYLSNVKLRIVDGEYKDRFIFTNLTTHPNASFITEGFLYAIGKEELTANKIPLECVNEYLTVGVNHRTYEKKTINKDTGLEEVETRTIANVNNFLKPEFIPAADDNLGL